MKGAPKPSAEPQVSAELKRTLSEDRQVMVEFQPNIIEVRLINVLLGSGLYGTTPKQCVARLVEERLKQLVEANSPLLKRKGDEGAS